jgi:hypothetical protein
VIERYLAASMRPRHRAPSPRSGESRSEDRGYALSSKAARNGYGCNIWRGLANAPPFIVRAAPISAAATDSELAIDGGVLVREAIEVAGVLRRQVPHSRLAVTDRRLGHQSRALCQ